MNSVLRAFEAFRRAKRLWVFASTSLLVLPTASGCGLASSNRTDTQTVTGVEVAEICSQTRSQIQDLNGGDEVRLTQCESQSDGKGGQVMVFGLNNYIEWTTLMSVMSIDDALFTVPLGVVASGFLGAGVEPTAFARVIVAFQDDMSTVYEINPRDMTDVLMAESASQVGQALAALRDKIIITGS